MPCCHNYANCASYSSRRWCRRHVGTLRTRRPAQIHLEGLCWTAWLAIGLVDGWSAATGVRGSWMLDFYKVLGLSRRATSDEIKAAYRALAKRHHPDVNAGGEQDEWRTKEINRAYEILGDAERRAAYDRERARQRTSARRRFWLSAATGAATVIVMASSVWVMAVWRQDASILQSQGSEPAVMAEDASPAQKPSAEIVANRGPAGSGDREGRDGRDETVIASVPELFGEPPSSTARVMPSTPRGDSETQAAAPSQPKAEPPPPEKIASAQPFAPAQLPQGHEQGREVSAPAESTPPRTELAKAAPLEVATKQPIPALTVAPKPRQKSIPRDAARKTVAGGRAAKISGRQFNVTDRPARTQTSPQGMQSAPRPVSKTATALRWPSADEPFVNVGGRSR